jgi:aminoglycoside phosphotransferase (APT) family kinase protein
MTSIAAITPPRAFTAEDFAQHICERAGDYFADIDRRQAVVTLTKASERTNSLLFEFSVSDGETCHEVVAKVPFKGRHSRPTIGKSRPRQFPKPDPQVKGWQEFQALRAIERHFTRLNDPRFGVIRVLDACGRPKSLLMEKCRDGNLYTKWRRANRLQRHFAAADLRQALHNVGAWLRLFHAMPPPSHTVPRTTRRADFTTGVRLFTSYLEDRGIYPQACQLLRDHLLREAHATLPNHLPLGLTHGDFAPHNVLLGPGGRVTVFDTPARWLGPVYEDLAYFLIALKVSAPQICSLGWFYDAPTLAAHEEAFLQGYFGDEPLPWRAIRLYEAQLLLDWWAGVAYHHQSAKGARRAARSAQLRLCGRFLSRYLQGMIL